MGNLIRWTVPESAELTYTTVYIYSSSTETGTYSEVANQGIADNTYFDEAGTTSTWYKVRFYDSSTTLWSDYSTALQGGTFEGYCTITDVRNITNLTTTDISDTVLYELIKNAMIEINKKISAKVIRERVAYLDNTRENDVDGNNTTYYIKNWKGNYLSDYNLDGNVTTSDVKVFAVDSDGLETSATVSSVTSSEGKFVLSTAYASSYELYVSYSYTPIDIITPDPLLRLATANLVAANAYLKRDTGVGDVKFGNVSIKRKVSDSYGTAIMSYSRVMKELLSYVTLRSNYRTAEVRI